MREDIIVGINSIKQALEGGRPAISLLLDNSARIGPRIIEILNIAKPLKIPVKKVAVQKLNEMAEGANHQGIILITAAFEYADLDEILGKVKSFKKDLFAIVCDEIEDPYNLGAIIRSAAGAGADCVIIPARKSAGLTAACAKAASGALEIVPVCKVVNIAETIEKLKSQNVWVYGADSGGSSIYQTDFSGRGVALVVGSEGTGLRRLVKEKCDVIVSIPMKTEIESLNASVASGIILFEIAKTR